MEPGDTVTLASDTTFRGTLVRMPRSVGRSQPRALVQSQLGEQWIRWTNFALCNRAMSSRQLRLSCVRVSLVTRGTRLFDVPLPRGA